MPREIRAPFPFTTIWANCGWSKPGVNIAYDEDESRAILKPDAVRIGLAGMDGRAAIDSKLTAFRQRATVPYTFQ